MKKLLVTFLGIAFLLPVLASAGSYCVTLPDDGNSKMSRRDNDVGVKFRYDFDQSGKVRLYHSAYDPDHFETVGVIGGRPVGVIRGRGAPNQQTNSYTYYSLEPRGDLCVYEPLPYFGPVKITARFDDSTLIPTLIKIRADVKYGRDCPTVAIKNNLIVGGDHKFEIYRRSGDHINPWGCKKK